MNKQRKNEKGFTMVELIIVVAIMGIIGALLVPAFGTMSAKARLSTDIATVKTLKRTADSYKADKGSWPGSTQADLIDALSTNNYLDSTVTFQTGGSVTINGEKLVLDVSSADYGAAYSQLASDAQKWVSLN